MEDRLDRIAEIVALLGDRPTRNDGEKLVNEALRLIREELVWVRLLIQALEVKTRKDNA